MVKDRWGQQGAGLEAKRDEGEPGAISRRQVAVTSARQAGAVGTVVQEGRPGWRSHAWGYKTREGCGGGGVALEVLPWARGGAGRGLLSRAGTGAPTRPGAPNGMRKDLTIKNIKHLLYHLPQKVHVRAVLQGRPRDVPAATLAPRHLLGMLCLRLLPWGPSCGTQSMSGHGEHPCHHLPSELACPCPALNPAARHSTRNRNE